MFITWIRHLSTSQISCGSWPQPVSTSTHAGSISSALALDFQDSFGPGVRPTPAVRDRPDIPRGGWAPGGHQPTNLDRSHPHGTSRANERTRVFAAFIGLVHTAALAALVCQLAHCRMERRSPPLELEVSTRWLAEVTVHWAAEKRDRWSWP